MSDIVTIAQQCCEIDRLQLLVDHWRQQSGVWQSKHALVNCDYADLKQDFETVDTENSELQTKLICAYQRIAELEDALGRVEVRRYEP